MTDSLRFIPLGGLDEVGMNCALLQSGDTTIAIDCGVGFTDAHGAELMHPDFAWLKEQRDRLDAIVITHGHEDHIGALPYLLADLRVPVYAPPYAAALIRDRLGEHRLDDVDLHVGGAGSRHRIGPFGIERFGVHHSIADATGLILDTPVGTVVHTGDFKIEEAPSVGQRFDRERLEEVAKQGVRLLLSDSTGAEVDGRAGLESEASDGLRKWMSHASKRIVVSTFSSNVFRLRAVLEIARDLGRKVCLLGMSMRKHTEVAAGLGLIPPVDDLLVAPEDVDALARDEVVILAGGTQGEPASSLTRVARNEHTLVRVEAGDTVILSSRIIPGNELAVFDVIDRFERRGLEVITRHRHPEVHASGHGGREEQRAMIQLVRPEAFVPVHGTHHHRLRHLELALEEGIRQTELVGNGAVLEVTRSELRVAGSVPSGRVYIDGMQPLRADVMRERRTMGANGLVTILLHLRRGRLRSPPRVFSRGVFDSDFRGSVERRLEDHLRNRLEGRRFDDDEEAKDAAIEGAAGYLRRQHRRRPLIVAEVEES